MTFDRWVNHRRSIRLPYWDYRETGAYFVTVCTHRRECLFEDEGLRAIAERVWEDVVGRGPSPGELVVMPNHVHGIVWIARDRDAGSAAGAQQLAHPQSSHRGGAGAIQMAEASVAAPLRGTGFGPVRRFGDGMEPGTLATIVRTFKAATAKRVNRLRGTPGAAVWQRNYYERVVRSDWELNAAREYILDNPRKWAEDKHNPAVFRRRGTLGGAL